MIRRLRPLLRGATYAGALFAYCAAPASLLLLPFAAAPAMAWRSAPEAVWVVLVLPLWALLIGVLGLARGTRRVLIAGARRLLRVPLPDPPPARPRGAHRWRTPIWLVAHTALGWIGMLLTGTLAIAALLLPGNWAGAQARLSLFGWSLRLTGGWRNWVAALCCLVLAAAVCAAVVGILRWLAPRLLGPSAAERLAQSAERELRLAERNRLAHELHDSIGHTLTATTIQAAVAGEVLGADPAAARAVLRSIEESSRAALEDLDYVLGALRDEAAGTAPTRTLADLPELLDRLRYAGAVVETDLAGDLDLVQGTLSRAAYRILQEGLTNALRHGAGGPIEVGITAAHDGLELSVVNRVAARSGTGTGTTVFPTSGHGLPGLAERVRLLHGRMQAGPQDPAHWRLSVQLPGRFAA